MFLKVRRTRVPEGISNVVRRAAGVTVVIAVSRTVRFANAKVVFARVVAGKPTGRTLHKVVPAANGTSLHDGNVVINVERSFRSAAISAEGRRWRSGLQIVSRLPLGRGRHFVGQLIQVLSRWFSNSA